MNTTVLDATHSGQPGAHSGQQPAADSSTQDAAHPDVVLHVLHKAEDLIHYLVAVAMIGLAGYVLFRSVVDFTHKNTYADRVIGGINGVLFVVIVLELLTTVLAHFHDEGFQLTPFLIIGGISAVRHILTIGAQESLGEEGNQQAFNHAQIGLAVNAGVTVLMVVALVLVRRFRADTPAES